MDLISDNLSSPSTEQHMLHQGRSFRYRPLGRENGEEIRLICLPPGHHQDTLRCEIFHVALELGIEYEALSYTWANDDGDATLSEPLECAYADESQFRKLMITKNCAAALRRLRDKREERILWIDAIAINQESHQERSQQVILMDQIYSQASGVIVYLGEEAIGLTEPGLWLDDRKRRMVLEKLFSRTWAERVWCVQEVALARKVQLIMGHEVCEFNEALSSRIRARARLYGLRLPGPLAWDPMVNATRDMMTLLDITRNCRASDPRDKVYALLGLASEQFRAMLEVDYTKSMEEVLTRTAEAIIMCQKELNILTYVSLEDNDCHSTTILPSWVPDW